MTAQASAAQDAQDIDTAVDKVQMLVLRTYAAIRAQISDQIELYAESFFKLPMMRKLADDMQEIELDEDQKKTMRTLRMELEIEKERLETAVKSLGKCVERLQQFSTSRGLGFNPAART